MIIGITGRKGSGKDTAADFVLQHPNYKDWKRVKFSEGLKIMLRSFLYYVGYTHDTVERMIEGDLKEESCLELLGQTPRHAMQTLGTEWGRQLIGDSLWISATKERCAQFANCIITDVRFENEVKAIREMGGKIIKINRDNNPENDTHLSETSLDSLESDYQIENSGEAVEMRAKILNVMKEIVCS